MLLEKPFAISEEEVNYLYKVVKETGRKVMICHVLRYAPFYVAIKQRLLSGEIGDIINIQATEHVSYHHLAVSFVRGKWGIWITRIGGRSMYGTAWRILRIRRWRTSASR